MSVLISALAVALTCGVLAWAGDLVRKLGFLIYTEQYIAAMVALALPLVYLAVPAGPSSSEQRRRDGNVPWYDVAAAALGFVLALYVAVRFPHRSFCCCFSKACAALRGSRSRWSRSDFSCWRWSVTCFPARSRDGMSRSRA
jgi:hypothetical protein